MTEQSVAMMDNDNNRQELLTTEELATLLRQAPQTIRQWRWLEKTTGTCHGPRGVKVGRRVLYPRTEVSRWLAEQATSTGTT